MSLEARQDSAPLFAGRYVLKEQIGSGSFGSVHRAEDRELRTSLALKLLHVHQLSSASAEARFRNEVRVGRGLTHPNIVRTWEFGHTNGIYFIAMELIDGPSLRDLLDTNGGRIELPRVVRIMRDVLEALDYAHAQGVIHRDLKPGNILIGADGIARLTDFSVSRALVEDGGHLTRTGEIVGTPQYMAPEQFTGGTLDLRSDLYSFAALAYELLCGSPPFEAQTLYALAQAHLRSPFPDPCAVRVETPQELARLIIECGAKDPDLRPPSARLVLDRLAKIEASLPEPGAPHELERWLKDAQRRRIQRRRRRTLLWAAVLLLLFVTTAVGFRVLISTKKMMTRAAFAIDESPLRVLGMPFRSYLGLPTTGRLIDGLREALRDAGSHPIDPRQWKPILRSLREIPPADASGETLLSYAVKAQQHWTAGDLLRIADEKDLAWRGPDGSTLLHEALNRRDPVWALQLMSRDVPEWFGADAHGDTPLMIAARSGLFEVFERNLKLLSQRNDPERLRAYVNHRNVNGRTASHEPFTRLEPVYCFRSLRALLFAGADLALADNAGRTPTHFIAEFDESTVGVNIRTWGIEEMLRQAANSNDSRGQTPLTIAIEREHTAIVSLLLAAGADVCLPAGRGQSALARGRASENEEVRRILEKHAKVCEDGPRPATQEQRPAERTATGDRS